MAGQWPDDLLGRGGHDVHAAPFLPVQCHEVERLLVHERVDHLDDHVLHQLFDLLAIPPLGQGKEAVLQPLHLLLVGPDQQVDELRVGPPQELAARDHARPVHRPGQRERAGLGDDRLVQVEERGFHVDSW